MGHEAIGIRMKDYYESRTQTHLPRRTYTIIRLDGKAFHTYTKGFKRPYDENLMRIMDLTAKKLCESIQGCKMAYVQSDEISLILTDFDSQQTNAWFDGNIQKIASISASIATAAFNNGMYLDEEILASMDKVAYFDSRVFTIPNREEVINYLIWRQQDAVRNSIQMGAQSLYSQKQLDKKNASDLQEMMWQKGVNWNDYPTGFKRGRMVVKQVDSIEGVNPKTGQMETARRSKWVIKDTPIFTQEKDVLRSIIPKSEFLDEVLK